MKAHNRYTSRNYGIQLFAKSKEYFYLDFKTGEVKMTVEIADREDVCYLVSVSTKDVLIFIKSGIWSYFKSSAHFYSFVITKHLCKASPLPHTFSNHSYTIHMLISNEKNPS